MAQAAPAAFEQGRPVSTDHALKAAPVLKNAAGAVGLQAPLAQAHAQSLAVQPAGAATSAWPSEDGGAERRQAVSPVSRLALQPGERLLCRSRATLLSTMTVLGPQGQVYLLTHSALRAHLGLATTARVERIHPTALHTLQRSPRLNGGPMWPGGMALHPNGSLIVVYGRHAHRLDLDCQPLAVRQLPQEQAYNGFVTLANGLVVTKNLSETQAARLSVLAPNTLASLGPDTLCPEPSVARLSAVGNTVYVVGTHSVMRYHWNAAQTRLDLDPSWRYFYLSQGQSFGWDLVLEAGHAWFMDNGKHRYRFQMRGAGVSPGANRLHRVSLSDAADHQSVQVSGLPHGSITNPPLVDAQRQVVLAYDSANACVQAFAFATEAGRTALTPLWRKDSFGCASHMLLYAVSGEVVLNDWRRWGEEVVVLDILTGQEKGRVRVGGWSQGVVFPSPGHNRDLYWCSMSRVARVSVEAAA